MAWKLKNLKSGVIDFFGNEIHIEFKKQRSISIDVDRPIVNAVWSGNQLNIKISDGTIRRYSDEHTYVEIDASKT